MIQSMKFLPKPIFQKTTSKSPWSSESKAFSISTVNKWQSMLNLSEISKISEISLPPLPMYLCWTYAVCCKAIRDGSADFSFAATAFNLLSLPFSSKSFTTARLCNEENSL